LPSAEVSESGSRRVPVGVTPSYPGWRPATSFRWGNRARSASRAIYPHPQPRVVPQFLRHSATRRKLLPWSRGNSISAHGLNLPDEGHWGRKTQKSRHWHKEGFAWLEKYCPPGGGESGAGAERRPKVARGKVIAASGTPGGRSPRLLLQSLSGDNATRVTLMVVPTASRTF